jgi:hypothetical protein
MTGHFTLVALLRGCRLFQAATPSRIFQRGMATAGKMRITVRIPGRFSKEQQVRSDSSCVTGRGIPRQAMCVLILALATEIGTWQTLASPQMPPPAETPQNEPEEDVLDLAYVRQQAESGKARFQTQLGDYLMATRDLTNAVAWYRKAAAQGDVSAQLSLAGCLMSGRGADKNPKEAAQWLRLAADRIEGKTGTANVASSTSPAPATVVSRTNSPAPPPAPAVAGAPKVIAPTSPPPARLASSNLSTRAPLSITQPARPQRADALISAKPVLQEIAPTDPK